MNGVISSFSDPLRPEWIEEVAKGLRKRGLKRSDLERIMTCYPSREIQAVYKKIMRRRKRKNKEIKVSSKLEEYLESLYSNRLKKKGETIKKEEVRFILNTAFKIPLNERGKLPRHIEKLIDKVRMRVYNRYLREKRRKELIEEIFGRSIENS
ncbi:hypothetical protein [Desulfurobacterium crinifex]